MSAAWLIVLTLSPFTAPFQSCDLTMFFPERLPAPVHGTAEAAALGEASLSPALPLSRPSARVRFIALSDSRTATDGPTLPAAGVARSTRPIGTSSPRLSLTILRI